MADYMVSVYDNVAKATISMAAMDAAFAVQSYGSRYSYVTSPLAVAILPSNEGTGKNLSLAQMASVHSATSFRNIIDGGDFSTNPWQRGTAFATIANTSTYTADRWVAAGNNASASVNVSKQTVTAVPGFGSALQLQRTAANANTALIRLQQLIESNEVVRLQGQMVTLSFWAAAGALFTALGGAVGVKLTTGITAYLSGFAGAVSPASIAGGGITLTPGGSYQRYFASFMVPAGALEAALEFNFTPVGTAGATDYIRIIGVQLEIGSSASFFEHRTAHQELSKCQRHCVVFAEPAAGVPVAMGYSSLTTQANFQLGTPFTMRAAPAVTFGGTALGAGTWTVGDAATPIVLGTPFMAAGAGHTANSVSLVATTAAAQTAGRGVALLGAAGGGTIIVSADL